MDNQNPPEQSVIDVWEPTAAELMINSRRHAPLRKLRIVFEQQKKESTPENLVNSANNCNFFGIYLNQLFNIYRARDPLKFDIQEKDANDLNCHLQEIDHCTEIYACMTPNCLRLCHLECNEKQWLIWKKYYYPPNNDPSKIKMNTIELPEDKYLCFLCRVVYCKQEADRIRKSRNG